MEKTRLTTAEFLSLYTGVLLLKDFEALCKAEEKVFGLYPDSTLVALAFAHKFRNYINDNKPVLVQFVEKLGKFKHNDGNDIQKEVDDYCKKFEAMIGKKEIIVDYMKIEKDEIHCL